MPDFGHSLRDSGVLKVKPLNEGADVRALGYFPCVSIAPLCRVTKEWKVFHLGGGLPVPFPQVPRNPSMKPDSKIQNKGGLVSDGSSLATLNGASCLSWEKTLIG